MIGPIVLGDHCFTEDLRDKKGNTPCLNGGICDRVKNYFQCQCKHDYLGLTCNRVNYCVKPDSIVTLIYLNECKSLY